MSETLRSWRLVGRPPTPEDAPLLEQIWSAPAAARWLSADGAPWPAAKVAAGTRRMAAHWQAHGFGPYLWFRGARFVGYAGLKFAQIEHEPAVEALWGAPPALWGRGFASEAAEAAMARAPELGFREVVAITLTDNFRSQGVMRRLGFLLKREIVHHGLSHVLYARPIS